jgi:phosphoglycerate dehydrogenase-like enzyme
MKEVIRTFVWVAIVSALSITCGGIVANAQQPDRAATELIEILGLVESPEPIREHPRWAKPVKVAVSYRSNSGSPEAEFLAGIKAVAGDAEVVLFDPADPGIDAIVDADVFISSCNPRIARQLGNLRWYHSYSVGVDRCLSDPGLRELDLIMSNNQRVSAPSIAELSIAMVMTLSKNLHYYQEQQSEKGWNRTARITTDLAGKTMLILGLGGIGTETARRASALGMRVIATRNSSRQGPEFVEKVGLSHEMYELAAEADIVVNALPLTKTTNGLIDRKFFDALGPGGYYINVGRGKTTVTEDLVAALNDGRLSGAGLDVMDPEPLPPDHPLWDAKNVLITPHIAGRNVDASHRALTIARENLRRYVQGEKLLSVVDIERGY